MPNQDVTTTFRFVTDRAATNATLRDESRIEDAMSDVAKAAEKQERAATDAEKATAKTARETAKTIETSAKAATKNYNALSSSTMKLAGLSSSLGISGLSGSLMIGADLLDAAEGMGDLKKEIGPLIGGLGAAGIAAGAAYLAFNSLSKAVSENKLRVQASIDAYLQASELLATGTKDQLKQEYDKQRQLLDLLNQQRAKLIEMEADYKRQGGSVNEFFKNIDDGIGLGISASSNFEDAIKKIDTKIQETTLYFELLKGAMPPETPGIVATNEQENLAKQRKATEDFQVEQTRLWEQHYEEMQTIASTWTKQQVLDRIQANEMQSIALEKQKGDLKYFYDNEVISLERYQAEVATINQQIAKNSQDSYSLRDLLPLVEARNQEAEAIKKTSEAMRFTQTALASGVPQALQKATDSEMRYQQDRMAQIETFNASREKIEADLATVLKQKYIEDEQARLDHEAKLADIQQQADDERAAELESFNDGETDRLNDYLRSRERAEEDHKDNIAEAAAKLDAIAIINEMRNYNKQKREDEKAFNDETKVRNREHNKRMKQLEKQAAEQLQSERDSFDKQQQQDREAFKKRQDEQANALRTELTQLTTSFQDKLTATTTAHANEITELLTFQSNEKTLRQQYFNQILAEWQSLNAGAATTFGATVGGKLGGIKTLDSGGYGGGLRYTRGDEFMLAPHTTRLLEGMSGGALTQQRVQQMYNTRTTGPISITLGDIGKYTPQKIKRLVQEAMLEVLEA